MSDDSFVIGPFTDYPGNPILEPSRGFQSKGVYNPTVIEEDGQYWMLYRAEAGDGLTGRIAIAQSEDGIRFTPLPDPILSPDQPFDRGGCEDPRILKKGNSYFLFYVGNSGKYNVSNICLATSQDLFKWEKQGPILEAGKNGSWDRGQLKAAVVLDKKIKGGYIMYYMGESEPWIASIGLAFSEDLLNWKKMSENPVLSPRAGFFDSRGVEEPGPNPVLLDEGILLVYNGWGEDNVYKTGAALFSREDPGKPLKRTGAPILTLKKNYGSGFGGKNHCVAEGLVRQGGRWLLYYGAADRFVCLATYEEVKERPC